MIGADAEAKPLSYAGFLPRLYAAMIDAALVGLAEGLLLLPLVFLAALSPAVPVLYSLVTVVVAGAYFVFFESSRFQATPGKLSLGLKVTDLRGERISLKRGAVKIVVQYLLYGLIFVIGLMSAGLFIAPDMKSDFHKVPLSSDFASSILPSLVPILLGNLLYFACFVLLVFSDRKQTVFDRLTGRVVWSTRSAFETSSKIPLMIGIFLFLYTGAFAFTAFKVTTHSSLEFDHLIRPILFALLGYVAVILLIHLMIMVDLMRVDPYGFIAHARILGALSAGRVKRLWFDRATAIYKYAQGDARSGDEVLLNWQGKLRERETGDQLQIRLFGCLVACDSDGIIETGLEMQQRQKFDPLNRLIVTNSFFRRLRYKEALDLLESIPNPTRLNAILLNSYFAGYYARTGCEQELANTLIWLEKHKYPLKNDWRLHLQGLCEAATGNIDRARKLLKQALSEFAYPPGDSRKPLAVLATMSVRRLKEDLTILESKLEDEKIDLSVYRKELKQIAKRLNAAGDADA
jgi:uncharacterized RDD family membrane protein YckC